MGVKKITLEIKLADGLIEPHQIPRLVELAELFVPASSTTTVVIISGRLPVWAYAALVHHYHPAVAVGTFDPRLGGAVVVASHAREYRVGDVIDVEDAIKYEVEI